LRRRLRAAQGRGRYVIVDVIVIVGVDVAVIVAALVNGNDIVDVIAPRGRSKVEPRVRTGVHGRAITITMSFPFTSGAPGKACGGRTR